MVMLVSVFIIKGCVMSSECLGVVFEVALLLELVKLLINERLHVIML